MIQNGSSTMQHEDGLEPPEPFHTQRERELWDAHIRYAFGLDAISAYPAYLYITVLARYEADPFSFSHDLYIELHGLSQDLQLPLPECLRVRQIN